VTDPVVPGTGSIPQRRPGRRTLVHVDTRTEIREFLTSRRGRITPEQAGLAWYGENRRVPGLRREEVALLAGVSVDYYTRLERGNLVGVSEIVLEAGARGLTSSISRVRRTCQRRGRAGARSNASGRASSTFSMA